MSRTCDKCGKQTAFGNSIARRGLAKYRGGVGLKTTGITRRRFKPNIQRVRVMDSQGTISRAKICTKCMRAGRYRKPLKRVIPDGLQARIRAKEEAKSPPARRRKAAQAGERRRQRKAEAKARLAAKGN